MWLRSGSLGLREPWRDLEGLGAVELGTDEDADEVNRLAVRLVKGPLGGESSLERKHISFHDRCPVGFPSFVPILT